MRKKRVSYLSAISVPRKPLFRCDNQCSEMTLSFWQLASVVIKEGEESYTTTLCQKCYNESLKATGEKPLTNWQWHEFVEKGQPWKANTIAAKIITVLTRYRPIVLELI